MRKGKFRLWILWSFVSFFLISCQISSTPESTIAEFHELLAKGREGENYSGVTLRVQGRPGYLDDVRMSAKFTTPEPVFLCFRKGRPLGYLSVGVGRYTFDFAHFEFLNENGRAPGHLDPSVLTDEVREVTEYEWEFHGRDFLSVSPNGREDIDSAFHHEIKLTTQVSYRSDPKNLRSRLARGSVVLPAVK